MKKILLLIGLALVWGGGQGIYTSFKNTEPTTYNINEITGDNLPEKEWVKLKNCNIDITQGVYFTSAFSNNIADEIYVPLTNPEIDSIIGFVAIKDEFTVKLFNVLNRTSSEEKLQEIFYKNEDDIIKLNQEVSGLLRFGIDLDQKENQQLYDSSKNVVANFILIDQGESPDTGLSYFLFILGLVLTVVSLIKIFKRGKQ